MFGRICARNLEWLRTLVICTVEKCVRCTSRYPCSQMKFNDRFRVNAHLSETRRWSGAADEIACRDRVLSKLKFLELSFNELTGFIPSEFGSIKNLKRLRMNLNKLTGTLPTQLGALQDLMFLNLESNLDINGPIPSELGNLSKLMALDLGQCSLTGSLPTDLGRMSSLEYLNVYNNKITGTLPTELGMLTNLRESRLQFTDLKGNVPNEICALRDERLLLLEADCTYDIRCNYPTCCTRCSD